MHRSTVVLLGVLLSFVLACGDGPGTAPAEKAAPRPAAAAVAPEATAALLQEVADVAVPTDEEARAAAQQSIDENNADAEFEKLKAEIEAEDG